MHRIDTATAVGSLPTPAVAGTPGYFQNAVPGVSGATQLDQDFFNTLQEELYSLLSVGNTYGIGSETPSKDTYDQVKTQIEKFVSTYVEENAGGSSIEEVTQATHGFAKYDVVRHNGTIFTKAQGDNATNAQVIGVISAVEDVDNFTVTYGGLIEWNAPPTPDYTLGSRAWLDNSTAGTIVLSEPSLSVDEISVVIGTSTVGGLLVEIDKGEVEVATPTPSQWVSEVSKTADYTILSSDVNDLLYVESAELTNLVFDFDAGFPDKGIVYLYCKSSNKTVDDETVHLDVEVSTGNYRKLFKGDGIFKVTKSSLTGDFEFGKV